MKHLTLTLLAQPGISPNEMLIGERGQLDVIAPCISRLKSYRPETMGASTTP